MLRKSIVTLLILVLSIAQIACSNSAKNIMMSRGTISPEYKGRGMKISIMYHAIDRNIIRNSFFTNYTNLFEEQYGVKVNFIELGEKVPSEEAREEYQRKLAVKLYAKDGSELLFGSDFLYLPKDELVMQNAVVSLRGKIPNVEKIYKALIGEEVYYVPIGVVYTPKIIDRKVINEFGIAEPEVGWKKEDYYKIREKWLESSKRFFTRFEYNDTFEKYFSDISIIDKKYSKCVLNTTGVIDSIKAMRNEIFSGNYILNKNYSYKNYYNMIYELQSEEYKKDLQLRTTEEYKQSCVENKAYGNVCNMLKTKKTSVVINTNNKIVLPKFADENKYIYSSGFLVNKNSKNVELACEFVNGLLSNEVQMKLFTDDYDLYPVNKEIEDEIRRLELKEGYKQNAIGLKEYALNEIKRGKCKLDSDVSYKEKQLVEMIKKDIFRFVFADNPYSDEELGRELKKLEDKYNIWLNE